MALTITEVEHVAQLARLTLSEQEKEALAEQLSAILTYVDQLNELPTDGVEPLSHILPIFNIFRPDTVRPSPSREDMLANAPLPEEGQYKVPKIV